MDLTTTAIVAAVAANTVAVLGGFALWLGHRTRRAERLEQRERERAQLYLAPVEARLAELVRAVEAISVEVERVAETQRYLMPPRPLTSLASPIPSPRKVTPH